MQSGKWIQVVLVAMMLLAYVLNAAMPLDTKAADEPPKSAMQAQGTAAPNKTTVICANGGSIKTTTEKEVTEEDANNTAEKTLAVMMFTIVGVGVLLAALLLIVWYTRRNRFPHPYAWIFDRIAMIFGHVVQA